MSKNNLETEFKRWKLEAQIKAAHTRSDEWHRQIHTAIGQSRLHSLCKRRLERGSSRVCCSGLSVRLADSSLEFLTVPTPVCRLAARGEISFESSQTANRNGALLLCVCVYNRFSLVERVRLVPDFSVLDNKLLINLFGLHAERSANCWEGSAINGCVLKGFDRRCFSALLCSLRFGSFRFYP